MLPRLEGLVRARQALPHQHAATPAEVQADVADGVFAVLRRHPTGPFLALHNMTGTPRQVPWRVLEQHGLGRDTTGVTDHLGERGAGERLRPAESVELAAYQVRWLTR
jgi:amylosucrase